MRVASESAPEGKSSNESSQASEAFKGSGRLGEFAGPAADARDSARLLVQSPDRLLLYWSLAQDPFITLGRAFAPELRSEYRLAVRLEKDGSEGIPFEASPSQEYWFDVAPGGAYRAHLGLYAPHRPFIRLLSSNEVTTPRPSISSFTDDFPDFHVSGEAFAGVLKESGYPADASNVPLDRMLTDSEEEGAGFTQTDEFLEAHNARDDWNQLLANIKQMVQSSLGNDAIKLSPKLSEAWAALGIRVKEAATREEAMELLESLMEFEYADDALISSEFREFLHPSSPGKMAQGPLKRRKKFRLSSIPEMAGPRPSSPHKQMIWKIEI